MSHRAVTQANAPVAPKDQILKAEPARIRGEGSRRRRSWCGEQLGKPSSSLRKIGGVT